MISNWIVTSDFKHFFNRLLMHWEKKNFCPKRIRPSFQIHAKSMNFQKRQVSESVYMCAWSNPKTFLVLWSSFAYIFIIVELSILPPLCRSLDLVFSFGLSADDRQLLSLILFSPFARFGLRRGSSINSCFFCFHRPTSCLIYFFLPNYLGW